MQSRARLAVRTRSACQEPFMTTAFAWSDRRITSLHWLPGRRPIAPAASISGPFHHAARAVLWDGDREDRSQTSLIFEPGVPGAGRRHEHRRDKAANAVLALRPDKRLRAL